MQPEALDCGNWVLYWSAIIWPAVLLVLWMHWYYLGRTRGWTRAACSAVAWHALAGIIIGARAAFVLTAPTHFFRNPAAIFDLTGGGLVFYGGLIGGLTGALIAAAKYRLEVIAFLDTLSIPVPLAHALGRIGCFLNGCCFGTIHHGLTGVHYPAGSPPWIDQVYSQTITRFTPRSLPVHPVQLYEASANLLLYFILLLLWQKKMPAGKIAGCYAFGYAIIRFITEFMRGDSRIIFVGVHLAQLSSLALLIAGTYLLLYSRKQNIISPGRMDIS